MDAAAADRPPIAEAQLDFDIFNSDGNHAVGPANTGPTEAACAPSTPQRPAMPSRDSTTIAAAHVQQTTHSKHTWSWLASAARMGRSFMALPRVSPSIPAEPSTHASQQPVARLGATRPLSKTNSSSSIIINDGKNLRFNHFPPKSSTDPTSSGSTHGERKKSRRKHRPLSTKDLSRKTSTTIKKLPRITCRGFEAEAAARRRRGVRFPSPSSPAEADFGYDYSSSSSSSVHLDTLSRHRRPSNRGGAKDSLSEHAPELTTTQEGNGNKCPPDSASQICTASAAEITLPPATATSDHRHHNVSQESTDITTTDITITAATASERQKPLNLTGCLPAEVCETAGMRSVGKGEVMGDYMGAVSGEEEEKEQVVVVTAVSSSVGLRASRGLLAVVAILYGTNFGCVKLLQETVPISTAALRLTIAVFPFLPFLIKINPGAFRAGVEIGLVNAAGYSAQAKSLVATTASKSVFICSLAVLLVPLLDAVFSAKCEKQADAAKSIEAAGKKHQGVVFAILHGPWFPALLALAGVACLELLGAESRPNTGDAWAMMQPLGFGVDFWLTERSSRKYPEDTLGIVAAHLLIVAVLAISWCALAGHIPPSFGSLHETVIPPSGSLVVPLALLWTGLVTTSLTVFLETMAMAKVSAAESTVIFSTEPIWGTAFAAMLLGETIGWNTGIGAVLIVLACSWSSVAPAIQGKLLSPMTATGTAATSTGRAIVNVNDFICAVGTDSLQRQNLDLV